jgi:hypothetical protein
LFLGKLDHGWRKVHESRTQTQQSCAIEWAIIKQNDFAAIARTPIPAQRTSFGVHLRIDARAVSRAETQCGGVAMSCATRCSRNPRKALIVVMSNEGVVVVLDNRTPIRLADQDMAVLTALFALALHLAQAQ